MSKIRVAVLRGGDGPAYEDSLKTGSYIISLLKNSEKYEPLDVFISREGEWHSQGVADEPQRILSRSDIAWNALHGLGESGTIQQLLQSLKHPFVGSQATASALSHHKDFAKEVYKKHGLLTPMHTVVTAEDLDQQTLIASFQKYLHPVIVKPANGVRGVGVRLAHSFHELVEVVKKTFKHSPKVMIEEYVRGTVVTCPVVEEAKGESIYAFLPTHLETALRRVRPMPEHNREVERMAKLAHQALGLKHYSASDFIITPRGKIYIIETNSQPLFHEDTMLHSSILASGWQPKDFIEHCLDLSLRA